jgi:FkbM family methyltransferase
MLSRARNLRALLPLVKWGHRLVPDRYLPLTVLRGTLAGRRLMLNLRYQMGYWLGLTEPDVQEVLNALIVPGDVVFDVGAEIGFFSVLAAVLSRGGAVFAFEPNPENLEVLHQTAKMNSDLHLTIVPKAVGDGCRRAEFLTYSRRPGVENASLLGRLPEAAACDPSGDRVPVDMTDLDAFSAGCGLLPAVVKIDVEGAEGLVLKGMSGLLISARPQLIIEIHSEAAQSAVARILAAHEYDTRPIGRTYDRPFPFRIVARSLRTNNPLPAR